MVGTLCSFCVMALGARELSGHLDTIQILFFRSVTGLVFVSILIFIVGDLSLFLTRRIGIHSLRNTFHFAGQFGWFLGITLLPLADVFALEFTVPFWTALIAFIVLKEKATARKIVSIILGLLGVVVIVQPSLAIFDYASLVVLGAAMCYAVAHTSTKSLSSSEHPLTILFFMCIIQLPIALFFSWSEWENPEGIQWFWVVLIGLTALSAHFCMTKAMQYADVTVVLVMDFFRLPVIAIIGLLLYSEDFKLSLILGAGLMLIGNMLNIKSQKK